MSTQTTTFISDSTRQFILNNEEINIKSLIDFFPDRIKNFNIDFSGLKRTIGRLKFDFYKDLLPEIARWASDHQQQSKSIEPLHRGTTKTIVYTVKQIRYILANAFFLNVTKGYGTLDLFPLFNSDQRLAQERILCLIEYFRLSMNEEEREISIERYSYGNEIPNWNEQNQRIDSTKINVFTERMENANDAEGFVDFANKNIHIHRIISSATQEEVLFSCCPEAFVSILLCEQLDDDEIVILRGCKRFIEYSGYGDTFRFVGPFENSQVNRIQDIIVIDACYCQQFEKKILERDLNKVWAGFSKSKDSTIVTGHWGCGVFGGDLFLKYLQQICATMVLDSQMKRLDYSVYGDENLAKQFRTLVEKLDEKRLNVADVYRLMIKYHESDALPANRLGFRDYVDQFLISL